MFRPPLFVFFSEWKTSNTHHMAHIKPKEKPSLPSFSRVFCCSNCRDKAFVFNRRLCCCRRSLCWLKNRHFRSSLVHYVHAIHWNRVTTEEKFDTKYSTKIDGRTRWKSLFFPHLQEQVAHTHLHHKHISSQIPTYILFSGFDQIKPSFLRLRPHPSFHFILTLFRA